MTKTINRRSSAIRRTVSLDPFVENMVRQHQAEMLRNGWRNANFSLSMNVLALRLFLDLTSEAEPWRRETNRKITQWIKGALHLGKEELQKWNALLDKLATQPDPV
jgi:hypothetical protein